MSAVADMSQHNVTWPSDIKSPQMKEGIKKLYGFPSCVGFVGEASFPLAFTPPRSVRNFYSRTGVYATSCLMVCDNK